MSKKYTIKFLCDFKADSWISLIDKLHQLKIDLLKCCNSDARITYDVEGEVVEINDYCGEHFAHFIGQISNINKESIDKLIKFITSSPLCGKVQFKDDSDEYSYYKIIEE